MIVSDKYKIAFIHIPKCGGTTVRNEMQHLNDWEHKGPPWRRHHPELGLIDYGHLPLSFIKEFYENDYRKLEEYWTFAFMRDPYERFASSISQRARWHSEKPLEKRSHHEIEKFILETIDTVSNLKTKGGALPVDYTHFQKQIDYIKLDDKTIVSNVYTIDQIEAALGDVNRILHEKGAQLPNISQISPANRTLVFRNNFVRIFSELAKPFFSPVFRRLPESKKNAIRNSLRVPRDERLKPLFTSNHVIDFVQRYYAEDLSTFKSLREAPKH